MADENIQPVQPIPQLTDNKVRLNKIWKAVALIVVSGIVFGAIGYWYGANNPKEEVTATKSATSSASTTDVTASWKTYINDTYGFSFKYPASWNYTDYDSTFVFTDSATSETPSEDNWRVAIDANNTNIKSLDVLAISLQREGKTNATTDYTTIGGTKAKKISWQSSKYGGAGTPYIRHVVCE
ncbi:MAG: PsbP-related protein [Candidatus Berkelbacteria bacterium]|nr:PsbP-related protein [Candidatus Berkelbacteria bacterium]